jgi:pimeloyl-ACP methyl ester carboxylesterase
MAPGCRHVAAGTFVAERAFMRWLLLLLSGCTLGGTGRPDQQNDQGGGVDDSACAQAMAKAPLAPAGYDFHDALPAATKNTWDGTSLPQPGDTTYPGGRYRTLTADANGKIHPGCTIEGLSYTPASIPGFSCAAREFAPASEDTTKPIVILVHGNSETPTGWMKFVHADPASLMFPADTTARDQLAEILPPQGYRTIAIDMRTDKIDDGKSPEGKDIGNTPKNADHGWTTPLLQDLIKKLAIAYPDRKLALVGFSLGATTVRDALRRLWVENQDDKWDVNIFTRVETVVVASGANHGVVSFAKQCGLNLTMRGTVTCQMGQRNQYTATAFHRPLNGPPIEGEAQFGGWWETPCADGDYAFGKRGACGGKKVAYTTITMQDLMNGTQQDEFVSEHAARLYPTACAANVTTGLNDFDTSGYFYNGFFRNHYGSVRSDAGIGKVLAALERN